MSADSRKPVATDWIAWTIHAIVGGIVGALAGTAIARGGRRNGPPLFASWESALPFIIGALLLGAAVGSHRGERWWSGPRASIFMTKPEGFDQSRVGRIVSACVGVAGIASIGYALVLKFR